MESRSDDRPSWLDNWNALRRAFPALLRAPEAQQQGFHERFGKLDQRMVAQAIERARESRSGATITVEYLMNGYSRLVPKYDAQQPSMAARIVNWWAMEPRGFGRAHGPFRSQEDARKAARGLPGATVKANWVKPGDGSWMAEETSGDVLPMETQRECLAHIEALAIALPVYSQKAEQWEVREPGTYESARDTILAGLRSPPHTPPLGGEAPEERASLSGASSRRALRTSEQGALSSPPLPPFAVREVDGMRLPVHRLPPELVAEFEKAYDVLARRDDGSPYGATAPGGLEGGAA